jgi:hypothetical protein
MGSEIYETSWLTVLIQMVVRKIGQHQGNQSTRKQLFQYLKTQVYPQEETRLYSNYILFTISDCEIP